MVVLVRPAALLNESWVSPRLLIKYLMLLFKCSVFSRLCIKCSPLPFSHQSMPAEPDVAGLAAVKVLHAPAITIKY